MIQFGKRRKDIEISLFPDLQTEIHIIQRDGKGFIQSAHFLIDAPLHHQARRSHCRHILGITEPPHIAKMFLRHLVMGMSCGPVSSESDDYSCVLDRVVRIIELCSHGSHILTLCIHQKLLDPVRRDNLRIVIQEQKIISLCKGHAVIVDSGIIKFPFIRYHLHLGRLLQLPVIIPDALLAAVVFHHDDLQMFPRGPVQNGFDAPLQIRCVILVGNHNTHQRLSADGVFYLKDRRKGPGTLHLHLDPVIISHMIMDRPLCRINGIGLGVDVRRHRSRVGAPVIQDLRDVLYVLCLFGQTEDHVVILAAVIFRTKQSAPL